MTKSEILKRLREAKGPFEPKDAIEISLYLMQSGIFPDGCQGLLFASLAEAGEGNLDVSLSAAVALIECVRPDANCHGYEKDPKECTAYISRNMTANGHWIKEGIGATPAIALVTALIESMDEGAT